MLKTPQATLNPDLLDTGTPPIPEAQGWARAYDGRNGPLIDLSQAVPGSPPPQELLQRLGEAAGATDSARYGVITGDLALREAYATEIGSIYGAPFSPSEIAITSGCNQAYVITMMALARAGDNVLLPTPWYFNHEMTLTMLGVEPRPLPCDPAAGFVPDVADAEKLIDARTRAIVLVTPNNPTGAVYPAATIAAFAELCARRGLWLVLDETYRDFLPEDVARPHEVFAASAWQDSVIGLYSFSKAYAVPGWRLGAITASETVVAQIGKVLDCVQISPVRAGQIDRLQERPEEAGILQRCLEGDTALAGRRMDQMHAGGKPPEAIDRADQEEQPEQDARNRNQKNLSHDRAPQHCPIGIGYS
jgi:aspartate/methionine/tyrosine aminotransferase